MPELNTILLYDCETNGVDPEKDDVVEAAGLLWDVRHESTVAGFSITYHAEHNAAEHINGVPAALVRERGTAPAEAWKRVDAWMKRADYVVAHNAGFDRSFVPKTMQNVRPWICTQDDVDWPKAGADRGLISLLLSHGLGVSHAHRALVDVMNMARLFERCGEMGVRPRWLLEQALRPKRRYKAVTGRFDAALNAKLKEHGFRWAPPDADKGTKGEWWRRLVVEDVPQIITTLPFSILPSNLE